MKKIINHKKYDTETAETLFKWGNCLPRNDFGWMEETLYRKKTGEFFLHGAGGPMSLHASRCGKSLVSGEHIVPLTEEEARNWAEDKETPVDTYESIFGEVPE